MTASKIRVLDLSVICPANVSLFQVSMIRASSFASKEFDQQVTSWWGFEDLIAGLYFYTCDICNGFGN